MKRAGGGGEREGGYWVKSLLDLGRLRDALACFLLLCGVAFVDREERGLEIGIRFWNLIMVG